MYPLTLSGTCSGYRKVECGPTTDILAELRRSSGRGEIRRLRVASWAIGAAEKEIRGLPTPGCRRDGDRPGARSLHQVRDRVGQELERLQPHARCWSGGSLPGGGSVSG